MKRIAIGIAIGVLCFGSAFAGAKVANLTNPANTDLDMNHFSILNGAAVYGETYQASSGYGVGPGGNVVFTDGQGHLIAITGCVNPATSGLAKPLGSLCLSTTGLYRKIGAADTDWAQIA